MHRYEQSTVNVSPIIQTMTPENVAHFKGPENAAHSKGSALSVQGVNAVNGVALYVSCIKCCMS